MAEPNTFLRKLEDHRLSHVALQVALDMQTKSPRDLERLALANIERVVALRVITETLGNEFMRRGMTPSAVFDEMYAATQYDPIN